MIPDDIHYVFGDGKMVTVKVRVGDSALEEDRYTALPPPGPQCLDEISLQEGDVLCVLAKGKAPVRVPKAILRAAAMVDPNMRTARLVAKKRR